MPAGAALGPCDPRARHLGSAHSVEWGMGQRLTWVNRSVESVD